jgi:hypothetical protein
LCAKAGGEGWPPFDDGRVRVLPEQFRVGPDEHAGLARSSVFCPFHGGVGNLPEIFTIGKRACIFDRKNR